MHFLSCYSMHLNAGFTVLRFIKFVHKGQRLTYARYSMFGAVLFCAVLSSPMRCLTVMY